MFKPGNVVECVNGLWASSYPLKNDSIRIISGSYYIIKNYKQSSRGTMVDLEPNNNTWNGLRFRLIANSIEDLTELERELMCLT